VLSSTNSYNSLRYYCNTIMVCDKVDSNYIVFTKYGNKNITPVILQVLTQHLAVNVLSPLVVVLLLVQLD